MEVDDAPVEVAPIELVEASMDPAEVAAADLIALPADENVLEPLDLQDLDSPDMPENKDEDPDYEPEVIPIDGVDEEAELSLAERLRNRKRRRGRPRKDDVLARNKSDFVRQKLPEPTRLRSGFYESIDTMANKTTRSTSKNSNITQFSSLYLECDAEDLSEAQLQAQMDHKKEFKLAHDKINEMIKNQTILFHGKHTMVLQSSTPTVPLRGPPGKLPLPKTTQATIKVTPSIISAQPNILRTQNRQNILLSTPSQTNNVTYLLPGGKTGNTVLRTLPPGATVRLAPSVTNAKIVTTPATPVQTTAPIPNVGNIPLGQIPVPVAAPTTSAAPTATSDAVVDLTEEDSVDSREISFNKLSGKTFPSLVVTARPSLKTKDMTPSAITRERATLDSKVKTVLVHSPTKFTEWLIQQGLVRSEQVCSTHRDQYNNPYKLKLGMYSDNTKFPFSGGYVWISECCPQKFVSVFSGSLFESSPHPPTVLLKLVYHWCCQTSVNNVVQWVKVDNFYVKNFYTLLRSVCTAAVHTKMGYIGGLNKYVEVGVISLGTTSQDGHQRQVKVEVLGVMDFESKKVRLMAVEPMAESDRNLRKRFSKILEPLTNWVHPASTILTDFSIDKSTLQALGFNNVYQNNATDHGVMLGGRWRNNANIMDYLRKVVPRMFLNTLSLLNRALIQQFLDELTWRERWGFSPPLTFDNIISHLAEQTKVDYGEQMVNRLSKIAVNPFKSWNYNEQNKVLVNTPATLAAPTTSAPPEFDVTPTSLCEVQYAPGPAHSKRPRAQKTPQPIMNENQSKNQSSSSAAAIKRVKLNTSAQTYLDAFYYAEMKGQPALVLTDQDQTFNVKCIICSCNFYNNLALMKHLISHVVYETNDATKADKNKFCPYCLKKLTTSAHLNTHKKDCHMLNTATTSCSICQKKFPLRSQLIQHMHQMHVASEIPYCCHVCNFRSSVHQRVVDHFHETHTGGCSLQCPLCLKVFYATGPKSRSSANNLMAFYQHLVGHRRQSNRRKCERCVLIFQQQKHVFDHEDQYHRSMRNMARVVPVVSTESNPTIIIPTPTGPPPISQAEKAGESSRSLQPKSSSSTSFTKKQQHPQLYVGVDEFYKCIECKQPLNQRNHLNNFMNCLLCRFSTCCSNAMDKHTKIYHSNKKKSLVPYKRDTILPAPMYCICGFKSSKGNELANHLEECEKKSAYPKPSIQAQSASFPPLVNLDEGVSEEDQNDKWMKAYVHKGNDDDREKQEKPDDGSIMGFLGLVRKSSTEDDIAKKPETEKDEEIKTPEDEASMIPEDGKKKEDEKEPEENLDQDDIAMPLELPLETEMKESNEVMELGD
ncbi:uncharacterized protein LOC132197399 [Neocloeon triangulifer]|uniref:uncharacterized protein LOC132197399 n=1 Tax=Neocloeon triangulifer TaxID=2078957 RepID=UPI00286F95BB|nr:uncharacterized protein LOC132197399 [Neocloeon triangulifer]